MKSLEKLRNDILSDDWEVALAASDALAQLGGEEALNVLIPLLSSESSGVRNGAALALREIKDNRVVNSELLIGDLSKVLDDLR